MATLYRMKTSACATVLAACGFFGAQSALFAGSSDSPRPLDEEADLFLSLERDATHFNPRVFEGGVPKLYTWDELKPLFAQTRKKDLLFIRTAADTTSAPFQAGVFEVLRHGFKRVVAAAKADEPEFDTEKDPRVRALNQARGREAQWDNSGISLDRRIAIPPGDKPDPNNRYDHEGEISTRALKKLADEGNVDAQLYYADRLLVTSLPQGHLEAIGIFENLMEQGNLEAAQFLVFRCSYRKDEPWYDEEKLKYYEKRQTELGDPQSNLPLIKEALFSGDKQRADTLIARTQKTGYFQKDLLRVWYAWALGAGEKLRCGGCFCISDALMPDFDLRFAPQYPALALSSANDYLQGAFLTDDTFMLIHLYLHGIGVPKDERKAFELAYIASMQADSDQHQTLPARAYLAVAYERGLGVEKNEALAKFHWDFFYNGYTHPWIQMQQITAQRIYTGFGFLQDKKLAVQILNRAYAITSQKEIPPERAHEVNLRANRHMVRDIVSGKFDPAERDETALAEVEAQLRALEEKTKTK